MQGNRTDADPSGDAGYKADLKAQETVGDSLAPDGMVRATRPVAPFAGLPSKERQVLGVLGGAGGIRTHDRLLTYTHFPGVRLRPLGHRSACLTARART